MKSLFLIISLISVFRANSLINLGFYVESLCPDCIALFDPSFTTAVNAKGIEKMVNITLVNFGNANRTGNPPNYTFTCQHGPKECYGNTINSCSSIVLK